MIILWKQLFVFQMQNCENHIILVLVDIFYSQLFQCLLRNYIFIQNCCHRRLYCSLLLCIIFVFFVYIIAFSASFYTFFLFSNAFPALSQLFFGLVSCAKRSDYFYMRGAIKIVLLYRRLPERWSLVLLLGWEWEAGTRSDTCPTPPTWRW